ncbi:MAG TPA: DUF5683 domain-containing protein [Candidatus Omnitrophota bacterium]|nr:DUF5683 domain-containing protein [Candidatus Omnitrophota bacterium]HPN55396.1 DUF5683 domain-containing protein [Candidatus Omnitrophota bacterium]
MMFCKYHPKRIALEKCERCGAPVCRECAGLVQGKTICPKCSDYVGEGEELLSPRKPWQAALLSALLPGMGQFYNGQFLKGLIILLTSITILPWFYGIYDAYQSAQSMNRGEIRRSGSTLSMRACLLMIVIIVWTPFFVYKGMGHYRKIARVPTSQESPIEMLKYISAAIENYSKEHGRYPNHSNDLYFNEPPYLEEMYCNIERDGFQFMCFMSSSGYRVTATPVSVEEGQPLKIYNISTGGIISEE